MHGDLLPRDAARRARGVDCGDDRLGRAARPFCSRTSDGRQALDRGSGRQGVPDPGAARRRVRCRGAAALRPGPWPQRRHARQARGDPRLALEPLAGGDGEEPPDGRVRDRRGRIWARARRSQALRAPRRDRDRRIDPAHRQLDHVEEDRRGHRSPRARREDRLRSVHAVARRRDAPRRGDGRHRRGQRRAHDRDHHGDGHRARPCRGQRDRGHRVGGCAVGPRRRSRRPGRGHARPGRRDGRARWGRRRPRRAPRQRLGARGSTERW